MAGGDNLSGRQFGKPGHDPITHNVWEDLSNSASQLPDEEPSFDLPPDREAYYKGVGDAFEQMHREKQWKAEKRKTQSPRPQPVARQPRQVSPLRQSVRRVNRMRSLARKARGGR